MKKKLALLLALVMVLALVFVGCDSDKDKDNDDKDSNTKTTTEAATTTVPPSTEELVVGKWTATVDFTDALVSSMGDMGDMADYFDFKDFELKFVYELKADKTYTIVMDEDVTEASADKLVDQMMDGMVDYMDDILAGSGMTFEDVLASENMTMDDYKASLRDEMDLSDFDISGEGTYTVDGNTIVLSEEGYDETTTFTYADGALKFVSIDGEASDEELEMMNDTLKGSIFKK